MLRAQGRCLLTLVLLVIYYIVLYVAVGICLRHNNDGEVMSLQPMTPPKRFDTQQYLEYSNSSSCFLNVSRFDTQHNAGVCVCCYPICSGRQTYGRTSRGHTGGRSHGISHPPSFCGACLNFSREKDSVVPFAGKDIDAINKLLYNTLHFINNSTYSINRACYSSRKEKGLAGLQVS